MNEHPPRTVGLQTSAATLDRLRRLAGPMLAAMERSGAPTTVTDPSQPDNPVIFVNAAFTGLTGYAEQEILGRNCRLLQGPDTDQSVVRRIREALNVGGQVDAEILNYRKDGTAFWNHLFITPIEDDEGKLAFFLATQFDATSARDAVSRALAFQVREREFDEVNERLKAILSVSGVSAEWEWHIDTNLIFGDARFAALYGVSVDEAAQGIPSKTFFSIIHPQDRTRIRLAVGGMVRGAEVFSKEYRLQLPGGFIRWVHARGRTFYDTARKPIRFNGTLADITEQKRVEERLRIAQTAGGVGTFEYVDGFATVSVSAQFCKLVGLHPALDLPVVTINAVVYPNDPPIIDAAAQSEAGTVSQVEFRIIRPDNGEVRWLTRRGEHLKDAETSGLRFSGVIYDITEAKRTEEQLRTLNETLEQKVEERTRERDHIWRVSRDLYVLGDKNGYCRSVNPAWETELGYAPEDLRDRHLSDFIHPDDRGAIGIAVARLARGEYVENFDVRVLSKDGASRVFSWTCVPEGEVFLGAGRDITLRNELEERLRQSQKMEAIGQLTGGIAHDFNNLLTGIIGALNVVRRRLDEGQFDDIDRFIEGATTSAHRAASLTHRLLAFSRRQSLDVQILDVNRLVMSTEELLRRTLGEQIDLVVVPSTDLWPCLSDANQLENALLNLAINARDAMPDGGRLTIITENATLTPDYARQQKDLAPGDYVAISVSDTGTGMSPETIEKAFDPFFTTKPIGQGTGLGLSMIYGFAKQLNGHVRIESTLGRGTTVKLYMPRSAGVSIMAPETKSQWPAPTTLGEAVLVIEDDPIVRLLVLETLQEVGYDTIEAKDSGSALPILKSSCKIDLVVSDVGLPGMDGRRLAEIAREHRPGLKILFMTGYAEKASVRADFLASGMDMIVKPFPMDLLAAKVKQILT